VPIERADHRNRKAQRLSPDVQEEANDVRLLAALSRPDTARLSPGLFDDLKAR
jgi:hypothetical protein